MWIAGKGKIIELEGFGRKNRYNSDVIFFIDAFLRQALKYCSSTDKKKVL